jgi:hypothetical protein
VHDVLERTYNLELPAVQSKLNASSSTSFHDAHALALLSQAKEALASAKTLATQGSFRAAVAQLNASSSLLDQAQAAERAGSNGTSGGAVLPGAGLTVGLVTLTAGIATILGLAFIARRRHSRQLDGSQK